ncbi:hypothetical protein L6164_002367 [Bauhinia variegata]|nr:hypothetical protein L6164_002367 [Bauhinia variegata]
MVFKRPRKLDLNAPLLSTRRLGCSIDAVAADTSCSSNSAVAGKNTSERVPFSWELAPGKAKDVDRSDSMQDEGTPRLKLPPSLWHPRQDQVSSEPPADDDDDDKRDLDDKDEGCDGDIDNDDVFSDAMDVLSLSEALDIVQKSEKPRSDNSDKLRLKIAQDRGNDSSDYIIRRFLPDATALAASSALHFADSMDPEAYHAATARGSYVESPKGCGLEIFFPWRMKQKLCSVKSPILHCSTNLQKHRGGSKQKK